MVKPVIFRSPEFSTAKDVAILITVKQYGTVKTRTLGYPTSEEGPVDTVMLGLDPALCHR